MWNYDSERVRQLLEITQPWNVGTQGKSILSSSIQQWFAELPVTSKYCTFRFEPLYSTWVERKE